MRKLVMLACVALAGAGVAILPSLGAAQASTASFTAVDMSGPILEIHAWYVSGTTNSTVTILPGGTVSFGYPSGDSVRNVVFTGPQPTSCTQTTATPPDKVGPAPPLPGLPEKAGWSGSCRFDKPGVYTFQDAFVSDAVTGTITVTTATNQPLPTTTTQPPRTPGPTSTTYLQNPPFPGAGSGLRAAATQHGTTVTGSVRVTTPGTRLVAELLSGHPAVRFGRTTIHGVADGTKSFAVHVYAGAVKQLRRRRSISFTLRVQLLSEGLGPTTLSRRVTLTR